MPVNVEWANDEQTIVLYTIEGKWTWNDFYPEYDKAITMEKAQPHRVDVVLDMRENKSVPPNALTHIKGITDRQPDNIGLSVLVTSNMFIYKLFEIAVKFYPKVGTYFRVTDTMDKAFDIIAEAQVQEEAHEST